MCVFDDNPEPESCSSDCTDCALHKLSTRLDIGESTLPPDQYINFKYSHNATKLVIC